MLGFRGIGHDQRLIQVIFHDPALLEVDSIVFGAAQRRQDPPCDLGVIDEVEFLSVTNAEADLVFRFVSSLYEKTSLVINSNKVFNEWVLFAN